LEAESALAALQEIDANVGGEESNADRIAKTLSNLTNEIDLRIAEDTKLLATHPSLELLYQLKLAWRSFGGNLSASARELEQHASTLEEQLARAERLNQVWQATLGSLKGLKTPATVLQRVQDVVDSVEKNRLAAESARDRVLILQSRSSEQEARVRTTLSAIRLAENRALKSLLFRDGPLSGERVGDTGRPLVQYSIESVYRVYSAAPVHLSGPRPLHCIDCSHAQLQVLVAPMPVQIDLSRPDAGSVVVSCLDTSGLTATGRSYGHKSSHLENHPDNSQSRPCFFANCVSRKCSRIYPPGKLFRANFSKRRLLCVRALCRYPDRRSHDRYRPACAPPELVAGHQSASSNASKPGVPVPRDIGFLVLVERASELFRSPGSFDHKT
jgi:hypothetical protein